MANKKNEKDKIGLYPGKKIKLNFYESKITPNGKQENQFSYQEVKKNEAGVNERVGIWFIKFWGDYNLKNGDMIVIDRILHVENFLYKKNGNYIVNGRAVITIKEFNGVKKESQEVIRNDVKSYDDDDYYYE